MDEMPEDIEQRLLDLFAAEPTDSDAEADRADRIVRRARRQVAAGDLLGFALVRVWVSLVELCAHAFVANARSRGAPRSSAS